MWHILSSARLGDGAHVKRERRSLLSCREQWASEGHQWIISDVIRGPSVIISGG